MTTNRLRKTPAEPIEPGLREISLDDLTYAPETPRLRLVSTETAPRPAKLGARLARTAPLAEVTAWLGSQAIPYRVLNNGAAVRIDALRLNLYISSLRSHVDGEPKARAETGFAAFVRLIEELM